jgi:hypothetical protein
MMTAQFFGGAGESTFAKNRNRRRMIVAKLLMSMEAGIGIEPAYTALQARTSPVKPMRYDH